MLSLHPPPGLLLPTWLKPSCLKSVSTPTHGKKSKRLGPSTVAIVRRWTAANSGFRPIRCDPSLHAPFEKFARDNKPLYDLVLSLLGSFCDCLCLFARCFLRRGVLKETPYGSRGSVLGSVLHQSQTLLRCGRPLPSSRFHALPGQLCWEGDCGYPCWRRSTRM